MLEARCPNCGYHCYGWALTEPEHQTCPKCGTRLEISQADLRREVAVEQAEEGSRPVSPGS